MPEFTCLPSFLACENANPVPGGDILRWGATTVANRRLLFVAGLGLGLLLWGGVAEAQVVKGSQPQQTAQGGPSKGSNVKITSEQLQQLAHSKASAGAQA